jgi:hypothetical protein
VHRHHHGAEIIRLQHRIARFGSAHPLFAAQPEQTIRKIVELFARGGIDDADAIERKVQAFGDLFHLRLLAEHDGCAELQGLELPRGPQDARFRAFGKNHPLRMPLQFFDDVANETHDGKLAAHGKTATTMRKLNLPPGIAAH